jgi:hypothetical protein
MLIVIVLMQILSVVPAIASTLHSRHQATLEQISGISLIAGLGLLGSGLPVFR